LAHSKSLPKIDDFRNFCMSKDTEKLYHKLKEVIIEELRNTYKLKELINLPVSVPNNV